LRAPQLNALASRFARGTRRGEVLLNGARFLERDFREFGVYVMQAEPLLATATVRRPRRRPCLLALYAACEHSEDAPGRVVQVRETIETSALLRLPLSVSRADKDKIVEEIIDQLVRARPRRPA